MVVLAFIVARTLHGDSRMPYIRLRPSVLGLPDPGSTPAAMQVF